MIIKIKHRYTNEVIYSCEAKTIREAVQKAVKENVSLSNSNLRNSDFRNSDLRNSILRDSDLSHSDFTNSDFTHSDLRNSDFTNSDFTNSIFRNSILTNSNFTNSIFSNSENLDKTTKLPIYCRWSHGITNGNLIHIGCEKRKIKDWDKFFNSDEKLLTERGTEQFKQIQAVYEAYKSYLTFLNK